MGLTVILPSAGQGSRLGLSGPKELFEILPGKRLIDFSLEHIRAYASRFPGKVRVCTVIRPGKENVADYVGKVLPGVEVTVAYFNSSYFEWAGSVFSAREHFQEKNIVLLPDTRIVTKNNALLLEEMSALLDSHPVCFAAMREESEEKLGRLGAVRLEENRVTGFQDKPRDGFERFNAFWVSYGFRKDESEALYRYLVSSIRHEATSLPSYFPAPALEVESFIDLGTWENIERFRATRP